MLRKSKCTLCNSEIEAGSLIPNHALRAAALAVKQEDDRRLFHNVALRKRRKEASEQRENGDVTPENGSHKGVQFPFSVNEKVIIKGNRRTPDKFVGKEAVITSQCLNGWYLLKIIESGENVRLQYRSLRKIPTPHDLEDRCVAQPVQNSSR
ncbi:UNVERIFIED_CONTAM: U-box domain-containing protein 63 [Sesamum latifolium]|uniref:U-box domain-containing protein 63 n=1 Tax=Sesamum latifolium TaxID=2727402 RepID=A0AAW2UZ43_9LAMI